MKNKPENHIYNFRQGAVFFGWLGTVVGLIAITGTPSFIWGYSEKIGPALAVAMLTILYGDMVTLVTIALAEDWVLFLINWPKHDTRPIDKCHDADTASCDCRYASCSGWRGAAMAY